MQIDLQPKQLAEVAGISPSHASNILSGTRGASIDIALAAFRAFGVRLGPLAELTDADIAKLASQQSGAVECHGCDAAASDGDSVHPAMDSKAALPPSTGQSGEMSRLGGGFDGQARDDMEVAA